MSKKKDPNIILRDKRLRDVVRYKKNAVKDTVGFGCPFLDRMVDEDYELMERVIKLEHFIWNVRLEPVKDKKGNIVEEMITLGEFTDAVNALNKKDRYLLIKQYKHMSVYEATLEKRIDRICKTFATKKGNKQ